MERRRQKAAKKKGIEEERELSKRHKKDWK
jgi:hypothetical protein